VTFASGDHFDAFTFKDGKTPTVDLLSVFKIEKGAPALRKYNQSPSSVAKTKVVGGAKLKKGSKGISKGADIKKLAEKISKFSPAGKSTAAKRSTQRLSQGKTPTVPSPGAGSHVGTTNHQSMEDFKRMMQYYNKKYKGKKAGSNSSAAGKASGGKRTGGKLSSKIQRSGKKSQK
jgi:hypothetical protein